MAINRTSPKKGKVVDIPTAPTIGTATAGAESATVAFTASTQGGPVTTFTALSNPGSITGTGTSPVTVSGLTAGTAYTFTVRGNNATGSSEYSSASNSITTPSPKATGGTISYGGDGYTYHTFTASGTFTPTQSLTADALVIAGGGGGGQARGGGGGAGGLLAFTSQSLTTTGYTVTVGAGGGNKTVGVDSQFAGLTLVKGGGFGGSESGQGTITGGNGGSGGGGSFGQAGGTATSGQGYNGGGNTGGADYQASGGGGAGAVGFNGDSGTPIAGGGGVGSSAYSSWGSVVGKGQNVSGTYYFAGGGGSSSNRVGNAGAAGGLGGGAAGADGNGGAGNNGTVNTGGGGGGGSGSPRTNGGSGGSGIVIIRYATA